MRVLLIDTEFPSHLQYVAEALAQEPHNEVVFMASNFKQAPDRRIKRVEFSANGPAESSSHFLVYPVEEVLRNGEAVYKEARKLKESGFIPNIVYGHVNAGVTLFIKDIFPYTPLLLYVDWYYKYSNLMYNFDSLSNYQLRADGEDGILRVKAHSISQICSITNADWLISPTIWQLIQLPIEYRSKASILWDGTDTDYYKPDPHAKLTISNLELSCDDEVVTYVSRGFEPVRGFHKFIEALALLQEQRPECHALIVGTDRPQYGRHLPGGMTYKEQVLAKFRLDPRRTHFTGFLPDALYRRVLQVSSCHVNLTQPFVLSWSLVEAMAAGCLVLASNTPPVREVIRDGENGLLVNYFAPDQIAHRIVEVLDHPTRMAGIRANGRRSVLESYALTDRLPHHLHLIRNLADRIVPPGSLPTATAAHTANRIFLFCPDDSGLPDEVLTVYQRVSVLRRHGFDAYVMHRQPGLRLAWTGIDVPIVFLSNDLGLGSDDILVIPEGQTSVTEWTARMSCKIIRSDALLIPPEYSPEQQEECIVKFFGGV